VKGGWSPWQLPSEMRYLQLYRRSGYRFAICHLRRHAYGN
jgi:hypothetical protein